MCLVTQSCQTLGDSMDCSLTGSSVRRDSPGKNNGMGCHVLLQEIFPTQVSALNKVNGSYLWSISLLCAKHSTNPFTHINCNPNKSMKK